MSTDDTNYVHCLHVANRRIELMNNLHILVVRLLLIENHMIRAIEIAMILHLQHNHRMEFHFPPQSLDRMRSEMMNAI